MSLGVSQSGALGVPVSYSGESGAGRSDKAVVMRTLPESTISHSMETAWAMQMKAVSSEEPSHLVKLVTGAILGCGGWMLNRSASDTGIVSMVFEFERRVCVDIYSVLIAAGLEFSQQGHRRFTELCQCTHSNPRGCEGEIVSIELEIQTFHGNCQPG